ncbi:hypothetical protein MRBLWH7_002350 [Microbacterium sp. LWH7-1.2]|uniref:hypothetical protein n=1 Tax=Microbacterium sp. LWH7-1.2 TaxID=3135257 RepID=UPI003139A437
MTALAEDADYQAMIRQQDDELAARARFYSEAERHIVSDLRAAGVHVDSVWDLVNTSDPYPTALPILMHHLLNGPHPDAVTEGLARALAVKPAVRWWADLERLYLTTSSDRDRDSFAVALAGAADADHLDDLLALASRRELGASRVLLLRPIHELGGARGRQFLEHSRRDPDLAWEVRGILGKE